MEAIWGEGIYWVETVLDNLMHERTKANIGTVKYQAQVITYKF